MNDTIAAIATAPGRGGVAIIRLSGDPLPIVEKMFFPKSKKRGVRDFEAYRLYPGEIDGGAFRDFGLCVFFFAPHSFTGEDVAELHCHGGVEIARGILKRAISLGARLAERGEFTKRAFLNGKLSLSSAEGMADMINGESEAELRAGYSLYSERLTERVRSMQNRLKTLLAGIDCDMDYPEEDLSFASEAETKRVLSELTEEIGSLVGSYAVGKKIKSGVSVALAGKPNAGKSSLLNALLGYDRAIVSDIAGTTRDTLEETIEIRGVKFRLIDTAGLRQGGDEIERIGISRSERIMKSADVVLLLAEREDDLAQLLAKYGDLPHLSVCTKGDLGSFPADVVISSETGEGLEALKERLAQVCLTAQSDGDFLVEERHHASLLRAQKSLTEALACVGSVPAELLAVTLTEAWQILGEISGETASEEIISEIFSKFCVGK
ncbi:MAG: tRNA uridine-5-carboxymethylaminomethyl(34) synthesis GTPase MnmE [Christensenellaceae bacterium]